jgi:hypothetical protein
MFGGGLEGCGPSQPRFADIRTVQRGADGAGALQGICQRWPIRFGGGGLRSLAAGIDGADTVRAMASSGFRFSDT